MSKSAAAQISAIVDRFGEVERQLVHYRPLVAEREDLRRQLQDHCKSTPRDERVTIEGSIYDVKGTACEMKRVVTGMKKLFEAVGPKVFIENCSFPLGTLDALHIDTSDIVTEDRTGPRTFVPVLREAARRNSNARVGRAKVRAHAE